MGRTGEAVSKREKKPSLAGFRHNVTARTQKVLQDKYDTSVTGLNNRWDSSAVHSDLRRT